MDKNQDDIVVQLNSLRNIKPRAAWKNSQREVLLTQISNTASEITPQKYFWFYFQESVKYELSWLRQPLVSLALAMLIVIGGGVFSITAASEATPGSFLYAVKILGEKTKFAFALKPEEKIKLNVQFAGRRAEEIKNLAQTNESGAIGNVAENLKAEINSANDKFKEMEIKNPGTAVGLAKDIEKKTVDLHKQLQESKNALTQSAGAAKDKLNEAIRQVDKVGLNALNVIVKSAENKSAEKKDTLDVKDAGSRIASKLKAAKEKINEVRADANEVFSAGFSRSAQGIQVYQKPTVGSEAKKETDVKTKEATKIIQEAEKLLQDNNLTGAVNKISESEQLLNEAAKTINAMGDELKAEEETSSSTPQVKGAMDEIKGEVLSATTTEIK